MSAKSVSTKPGNRKLVIFFKVLIISILVLPWIVAGLVGLSFYGSAANYNQEIRSYQQNVSLLQSEKEAVQSQLDDTNEQLTEVTEERDALQRSVLEPRPDAGSTGVMGAATTTTVQDESEETTVSAPAGEQLEELSLQVIRGNWGNGLTRVLKLQEAGYNHSRIQQRVNEIIWDN